VACSVDIGRAIYHAEAHKGVGGGGYRRLFPVTFCLGALAACAQITCQMVAAAMGIPTERIEVTVEGDLDLRGTLWHIKRPCRSALRAFIFILMLLLLTQPRNNCADCAKRQSNIV